MAIDRSDAELEGGTQCFECGRKAKWFGPVNRYTAPKLLCGYHKRAYTNVLRLLSKEPVALLGGAE